MTAPASRATGARARRGLGDLAFTVIDTAGLEEAASASLTGRMRAQTKAAIEASDVVLMLVDARAGILPADRDIADARAALRQAGAARRQQGGKPGGEQEAYAGFALGLGEPIAFSAEHGLGLGDLHEALSALLPASAISRGRSRGDSAPEGQARRSTPRRQGPRPCRARGARSPKRSERRSDADGKDR